MKKQLFVISDIHGHFTEALYYLTKAGWQESNPDHLLIVCGDMFDRGTENVRIFQWLYHLTQSGKAIVTRGNHDTMLIDYLESSNDPFNYYRNGTKETIDDFLGRTNAFASYCIIDKQCEQTYGAFASFMEDTRKEINEQYPELLPWLKSLPWYYETENYIFTHASIDTACSDWHNPHYIYHTKIDWDALTWDDGSFLGKTLRNTDKTVVVGHFDTGHLRRMYNLPYEDGKYHSILDINDERGHKIFIDGCVALTNEVNVLHIEDKIIEKEM